MKSMNPSIFYRRLVFWIMGSSATGLILILFLSPYLHSPEENSNRSLGSKKIIPETFSKRVILRTKLSSTPMTPVQDRHEEKLTPVSASLQIESEPRRDTLLFINGKVVLSDEDSQTLHANMRWGGDHSKMQEVLDSIPEEAFSSEW